MVCIRERLKTTRFSRTQCTTAPVDSHTYTVYPTHPRHPPTSPQQVIGNSLKSNKQDRVYTRWVKWCGQPCVKQKRYQLKDHASDVLKSPRITSPPEDRFGYSLMQSGPRYRAPLLSSTWGVPFISQCCWGRSDSQAVCVSLQCHAGEAFKPKYGRSTALDLIPGEGLVSA